MSLTPEQLYALMQSGVAADQLANVNERMQSSRANFARQSTPEGMFGAAIGGGLARMDMDAERRKLAKQQAGARQLFAQQLQANGTPDISSLFTGDEATGADRAAALAKALGGERNLGLIAQLSGDDRMAAAAKGLLGNFEQGQGAIIDWGKTRQGEALKKALAAQESAAEMERLRQQGINARDLAGVNNDAEMARLKYGQGQENWRLQQQLGAKKDAAADAAKKQALDTAEGLRKELSGNPITKQFQDVAASYGKVQSIAGAQPSPAGDMSLIFSYMKMMDPGSSVREGEYANASNTTGIPGQIINAYNKAVDGQLLSKNQRQDFVTQAGRLYKVHEGQYGKLAGKYTDYAKRVGVAPEDVVFGLESHQSAPAAANGLTPAEAAELAELQKRFGGAK